MKKFLLGALFIIGLSGFAMAQDHQHPPMHHRPVHHHPVHHHHPAHHPAHRPVHH